MQFRRDNKTSTSKRRPISTSNYLFAKSRPSSTPERNSPTPNQYFHKNASKYEVGENEPVIEVALEELEKLRISFSHEEKSDKERVVKAEKQEPDQRIIAKNIIIDNQDPAAKLQLSEKIMKRLHMKNKELEAQVVKLKELDKLPQEEVNNPKLLEVIQYQNYQITELSAYVKELETKCELLQRYDPDEHARLVHRLKAAEQRLSISEEKITFLQARNRELVNIKVDNVHGEKDLLNSLKKRLLEETQEREKEREIFHEIFKEQEGVMSNLFLHKKIAEQKQRKIGHATTTRITHPSTFFKD